MFVRPAFDVVVVGIVENQRFIGTLGIADPDPGELIFLNDWITAHARARRHRMAAWHRDAFASVIEHQSVVAALESLGHHFSKGQRRSAMTTAIGQRYYGALDAPEQHDRLVEDPACQRRLADLVGPCGDIPCVPKGLMSKSALRIAS